MTSVFLAVCERADILVDFSNVKPGTKIVLRNSANAPSGGDAPDANTGVVMQFTVKDSPACIRNPARHADHDSHARRKPNIGIPSSSP